MDKAIYSYGQYDLQFSAFVAGRLSFNPIFHYFAFCNDALDLTVKYSE